MQETAISTDLKAKIIEAYKLQLLNSGEAPASVFKFCKELEINESDFYTEFSGFEALDKALVERLHQATAEILHSDDTYKGYDTRGKLLAYMFSFIEVCNADRSLLLFLKQKAGHNLEHGIGGMKTEFTQWAKTFVFEGIEKGDIVNRPFVSDKYADGLWMKLLFIYGFWLKDNSKSFSATDAAIEKAVNLFMDLAGRNAIDSLVDFAKFLAEKKYRP